MDSRPNPTVPSLDFVKDALKHQRQHHQGALYAGDRHGSESPVSPPMGHVGPSPRSSWPDFYQGRFTSAAYRSFVQFKYKTFLDFLEDSIEDNDNVLEVGIGTGVISSILNERNNTPAYFGIDIDQQMVTKARKQVGAGYVMQGDMCNVRSIQQFSPHVIHGMGVLEHLSDEDIKAHVMAARASGAFMLIHYVPGVLHVLPSYGDERLMDPLEWQRIAAPTETILFNDAKDYVLVWRFR